MRSTGCLTLNLADDTLRVHEEPQSHRPAANESKKLLPHLGGFLAPFDYRVNFGVGAQANPLFHPFEVGQVLSPQVVDGLQKDLPPQLT